MIRWSEAGPQALRSWALILDNCVPCAVGDAIFFCGGPPRLRPLRVGTASGWPRMALGWGVPPVARRSGPRAPPPGPAGPPPSHPARLGAAPATGPGRHVAAACPLRIGGARAGPAARPLSRLRPQGSRWEPLGPCWARACRNGHLRAVKGAPRRLRRWPP